jgi:transglutaminase-like putative cysteine protease
MTSQTTESIKIAALGWLATSATSLAFLPALSQQRCVPIGAALSAVVVALGIGLRRLGARPPVVLLAQLVAVVEVLAIAYGRSLKYGVLPTSGTVAGFRHQIDAGMAVANQYAAPAPASPGLLLMVVFFVACMAALVDFLAAGLHRAPLAGLPLLALYTVPVAALPDGVPFYEFVPGALSYLVMLMADERYRLAHWGRLVSRAARPDSPAGVMDTSGLTANGRRICTLALLTAVFVPLGVPVLSTTIWGRHAGKGGTGDGATLTFSNPMVSLANSLRNRHPVDLLTVTSDVKPQYIRLAVLDSPGPDAWTANPLDLATTVPLADIPPRPSGMSDSVSTSPASMTISLDDGFPGDSTWLPVPYLVRSLTAGPKFNYLPRDQTVAATSDVAGDLARPYDVSYATMRPTAEQLRRAGAAPPDILSRDGGVPQGVPPVVAATARAVTAGATTDYDRALLLQSFFRDRSEFSYDLNAGYGYGYRAMAQFLHDRRGFCQHFAATMAMMARTLGIPSRVVVGFLEPERSTSNSSYVFTSKNLHSWPELYFQGVGWVRFEPTQGVGAPFPQWATHTAGPRVEPTAPTLTRAGIGGLISGPTTSKTAQPVSATGGSGTGGNGAAPSKKWLFPLGALAVLFLPASLRFGVRRNRLTRPLDNATAAEAAWLELRDFLKDLHLPWSGSMTPRARERSIEPLVGRDAEALSALRRLALCVERARYANTTPAEMAPAADAETVMAAISRRTDRGQRLRALLWPASLLPDLRVAWDAIAVKVRRRSAQ